MTPLRILTLALALGALRAPAAPTLAPLFQDHAVLQADKPIPVWGRAEPGEHVKVSFHGLSAGAQAGPDGRWTVVLPPVGADPVGGLLAAEGRGTASVRDAVVGEVWICSGQSNMEFTLNGGGVFRVDNAEREVADAQFPLIRQFKVAHQVSDAPRDTVSGSWQPCTPASAAQFCAVGYFFARDIHRRLGVPVGIVTCTWSGSPLESWMSASALAAFPGFTNGHPEPGAPPGREDFWVPGCLFNGMVNPLLPYAVRGVLWYQGESNVGRAALYARQFPALISSWRSHLGQGDIPFLWVQLPGFAPEGRASGDAWALFREAQSRALALPATGEAVSIDIGDPANVHPRNKQEVGRRLALLAKARVYGIAVDDSGPALQSLAAEGASMRVSFAHAAEGLTLSTGNPQSFEVAGADRKFHRAEVTLAGDSVVLRSPAVPAPVAVRYAWRDAPAAELFNGAGLPAAPFRSDAW
jgi:sialate O-acetylesterase